MVYIKLSLNLFVPYMVWPKNGSGYTRSLKTDLNIVSLKTDLDPGSLKADLDIHGALKNRSGFREL